MLFSNFYHSKRFPSYFTWTENFGLPLLLLLRHRKFSVTNRYSHCIKSYEKAGYASSSLKRQKEEYSKSVNVICIFKCQLHGDFKTKQVPLCGNQFHYSIWFINDGQIFKNISRLLNERVVTFSTSTYKYTYEI